MIRNNSFGGYLENLRISKGYDSQRQLAIAAGLSPATISRIESNIQRAEPDTLKKLAPVLGVPYEDLMRAAGYLNSNEATSDSSPVEKITAALVDDPELFDFWQELKEREDLQLLFKQVKPLSQETIRRIIRYIKMVEDEEAKED